MTAQDSINDTKGNLSGGAGTSAVHDYKYSGIAYGGRLGVQFVGFMAGAQYDVASISNYSQSSPVDSSVKDSDVSVSNTSVFAGYTSPLGVRIFGNYFFSSEMKEKSAGTNSILEKDNKLADGSGFGVGVGYKILLLPIAFNIEYRMLTYTKITYGNGDDTFTT